MIQVHEVLTILGFHIEDCLDIKSEAALGSDLIGLLSERYLDSKDGLAAYQDIYLILLVGGVLRAFGFPVLR